VGVELYQQMLEQAVADAKVQQQSVEATVQYPTTDWSPTIQLGIPVLIPERYVADLDVRLGLYRRAAELVDAKDIEDFTSELIDRFGALPVEVENFLQILMLKRQCLALGVNKVDAGEKGVVIGFHNNSLRNPEALLRYISAQNGVVKLRPDQRVFFLRSFATTAQKIKGVEDILRTLEKVLVKGIG
jgi:transcription-repair coupling factor (superfamily II helicase)